MQLPDPFGGRYTNLRLLGRGGFGVVYRAWDLEMERDVALKLLNPDLATDADWRKRFRQEATAASKLNHPNITIVFDRGEFEDRQYIVMEFVEGETLSNLIEQRVPLSDLERLLLIEQLCDGLHYAHQRHVVHRDIKPVNLIVHEDYDGTHLTRTLKILDFGIAKVVNSALTATGGQLMFTPNYVSPEQIRGAQVDRRCDIFAVGAVAYELLTLEKAFVVTSKNPFTFLEEVRLKIVEQPHKRLTDVRPGIAPELGAIIDRALAKNPDDRYPDLAEMRNHLRRVRERLQQDQSQVASETTVTLNPESQAALRSARRSLEIGEPDAAVSQLETALKSASAGPVRRFLERSLQHARERQVAKRAEEAIATAILDFQQGDHRRAISRLQAFEPRQLVAEQLSRLHRALDVISMAERAVIEGASPARAAALYQLDRFVPAELTKGAALRLRAQIAAAEEDENLRKREQSDEVRGAIVDARDLFRAGRHAEAEAVLSAYEHQAEATAARQLLRRAATLIEDARNTVEHGTREERARSLQTLTYFEEPYLVEPVLEDLRERDKARTNEEDGAAVAAVNAAIADFESGNRHRALEALGKFTPAHPQVVGTLHRLRQRNAELARQESDAAAALEAANAAARKAIEAARNDFKRGDRAVAIASLEAVKDSSRVAEALERLRSADSAIEATFSEVRSGSRAARSEAIARLSGFSDPELVAGSLLHLHQLDEQRRSAEDHQFAASGLIASAREEFERGDRAAAIDRLIRFTPPHQDVERLAAELRDRARQLDESETRDRQATEAIEAARVLFAAGQHAEAIANLDAFPSSTEAVERAAAELRAEKERIDARAARERLVREAETISATARDLFRAGAIEKAIALLMAFREPGQVAEALRELRGIAAEIETARSAVATGSADVRRSAVARLKTLEPSDLVASAIEELGQLAEHRDSEERRLEAARLSAEAQRVSGAAREAFITGDEDAAIGMLERFDPADLVQGPLSQLRGALDAITRARLVVSTDDDDRREEALAALGTFDPPDLTERAIQQLRDEHLRRRAAEEAQRVEREILERAEGTVLEARSVFDAGDPKASLALLDQFDPPHPAIEAARSEFRRTIQLRDLRERAEHALNEGRLADARSAIVEAKRLQPGDPATRNLEMRFRLRRRSAFIERTRHLAVRSAAPLVLAAVIGAGGYLLWSGDGDANLPLTPVVVPPPSEKPSSATPSKEPDSPPPVSTPGAGGPPTGSSPDEAAKRMEEQLQPIRREARRQLSSGRLTQALESIERGLKIKGDDPALNKLLNTVTTGASGDAATARRQAFSLGASSSAKETFDEAVRREQRADNHRRAGRLANAVPDYLAARDGFSRAAKEASAVVAAKRPDPDDPKPAEPKPAELKPEAPPTTVTRPPATNPPANPKSAQPKPEPSKPVEPPASDESARRIENEASIREVLNSYEAAFARRDIDALRRIQMLTDDELQKLRDSFRQARAVGRDISVNRIAFSNDNRRATVVGEITLTYTPQAGDPPPAVQSPATFILEKRGESWVIVSLTLG